MFIGLCLILALLAVSCKTSRKLQQKKPQKTEQIQAAPESVKPINKAPKPATQQKKTALYRWVSYRGTANIHFDNKKYQCNYNFVNRTDSIIYLNINMMGIELARLVATPAKVTFVNKLSNEYYEGDYAFVEKFLKTKADFYTLQALFNGDEVLLKPYTDIQFEYGKYLFPSTEIPFFNRFSVSMNNGARKIDATVTNLKFNVPGSTGIKIPAGCKAMKL